MQLDTMEKRSMTKGTKKETQKCYNCGIKEHLARDYRKPKTEAGPQRK